MHAVIDSAMFHPFQNRNYEHFDLSWYACCKSLLDNKDKVLANQISFILNEIFSAKNGHLNILDVGTGEASLIKKIILSYASIIRLKSNLTYLPSKFNCVEPELAGIEQIKAITSLVSSAQIGILPHNQTIQEFLLKNTDRFDVILCIHVLYHIDRTEWMEILSRLISRLNKGGILLVNLVSYRSDIYRLLDKLEPVIVNNNLSRTFSSCGDLYFSEDLEQIIRQLDNEVTNIDISSTIDFSIEDLISELDASDISLLRNCSLIRFLSFMFRITPFDLAMYGKPLILSLLSRQTKNISFKTFDRMFIIKR